MKKLFSSILILGMLTISSCTSDEPMGENNGNTIDTQINNYLTVNIMPTATPTRAEGATGEGDNTAGGKAGEYEDGTALEQQVNTIRFFFFDNAGNGAPVNVISDNGTPTPVSYIDWTHYDSNLGQGDPNQTIEATLSATLALTIPDNVGKPTSLIAIINPSETVKNLTVEPNSYGPTRSVVQNAVADYETGLTNGNFVMSNSVYANTGVSPAVTVNYTDLVTAEGQKPYFQSSIEAAQSNPVTIYVERVAARLDLIIALNNPTPDGYYPVMKKVEGGADIQASIEINGKTEPIYVNFLGWNVTTTTAQSYLVKNIIPTWTTSELFGTTNLIWNSMDYHRSFWAINPNGVTYHYGNFGTPGDQDVSGNYQPARANPMPAPGASATTYMQENASPFGGTSLKPSNPTQVIIAAQLVTGNGTPVELAEWGYNKYTQPDLLKYLVTNIISKGNYYRLDSGKYVSLTDQDLTFVSASQYFGDPLPPNVKSYYSYIKLNPTLNYTWYQWNGEGEEPTAENLTEVNPSDINTYILNNVGYTLMWNKGYTYYYFDVQHLGQEGSPAFYGIVRNHIYRATVNTLYGYGTPVCNPSEIIIPEAPEYEEVILAAEIKILQWRVVSADYTLEWR